MADLCVAFKRIVPRYQFSKNVGKFVVEELGPIPNKPHEQCENNKKQCGIKYCTQMDSCQKRFR